MLRLDITLIDIHTEQVRFTACDEHNPWSHVTATYIIVLSRCSPINLSQGTIIPWYLLRLKVTDMIGLLTNWHDDFLCWKVRCFILINFKYIVVVLSVTCFLFYKKLFYNKLVLKMPKSWETSSTIPNHPVELILSILALYATCYLYEVLFWTSDHSRQVLLNHFCGCLITFSLFNQVEQNFNLINC